MEKRAERPRSARRASPPGGAPGRSKRAPPAFAAAGVRSLTCIEKARAVGSRPLRQRRALWPHGSRTKHHTPPSASDGSGACESKLARGGAEAKPEKGEAPQCPTSPLATNPPAKQPPSNSRRAASSSDNSAIPHFRSRCESSSRPASTSVTRPSAGTRRCARTSTARAAASTSSISTRRTSHVQARLRLHRRRRSARGGSVLFVGTKRQAQEIVAGRGASRRHVLRHQPLARRHAHQLPHHQGRPRSPALARAHARGRHLRATAEEGDRAAREGARAPREVHRRLEGHGPAAAGRVRDRSRPRVDRGQRVRASSAFRSSRSPTPTAIPIWSTTSSRATTTRSARFVSSLARSPMPASTAWRGAATSSRDAAMAVSRAVAETSRRSSTIVAPKATEP